MTDPILVWMRRDLRLRDNPALSAAAEAGPVIPVILRDDETRGLGAAMRWRFGLGVEALAESFDEAGAPLVLRSGAPSDILPALARETGARAIYWNRRHDAPGRAAEAALRQALDGTGIEGRDFAANLLFEPGSVRTGGGTVYKVFTPFWRAIRTRDVAAPLPAPRLAAPSARPDSENFADWALGAAMNRGAAIVAQHVNVGEDAASSRLAAFTGQRLDAYAEARDRLDTNGTSNLSENLAHGEITARAIWHAGRRAQEEGRPGAETFLKELAWREFAWHLMADFPRMETRNWREQWNDFPWRQDNADAQAWRQGRTGEPIIDAAMREMYVTGRMHNRARMIVASHLTKHLLTDWRVGLRWFAECLIDHDPASNALGWQWVAGPGPDATPYFRVFNPETQAKKFDPEGAYRDRWIAEGQAQPPQTALSYFDAVPRSWNLAPDDPYPQRIVGLKEGRARALEAYHGHDG